MSSTLIPMQPVSYTFEVFDALGNLSDADALPVATLLRNGAAVGPLSVARDALGTYTASGVLPAEFVATDTAAADFDPIAVGGVPVELGTVTIGVVQDPSSGATTTGVGDLGYVRDGTLNHHVFLEAIRIGDAVPGEVWTIAKSGLPDQAATVGAGGLMPAPTWPITTQIPTGAAITYLDPTGAPRVTVTYHGPPSVGHVTASSTGDTVAYALHGTTTAAEVAQRGMMAIDPSDERRGSRVLGDPAPTATAATLEDPTTFTANERIFLTPASYGSRR